MIDEKSARIADISLYNYLKDLNELSDLFPLGQATKYSSVEGVLFLFDADKKLIRVVSATNDLSRRLPELLKDDKNANAEYFQYLLNPDRIDRFRGRRDAKEALKLLDSLVAYKESNANPV
ncbi:hypothetical protein [Cohnella sp. GCM10012308]|uniref:hypothetical protein n=1 Tax=Cohnella sp. GCM10012308 TaxID=3317329 RepID=UPI00360F5562